MAAIFAALLTYCQAGDHVLCAADIYGGSAALLNLELSRLGIAVTYVPFESLYDLAAYVQPTTRLLLCETMSNPLLRVVDLRAAADECHRHGLKLVVDNTFSTPVLTRPLAYGADLVLHSVTKYLAGHSDVTAGAVVARTPEDAARLRQIGMVFGLTLSPMESWLAVRGMKTMRLRVAAHSDNAQAVAEFLDQHPAVAAVYYPGLPAHPQHALAAAQGGGLLRRHALVPAARRCGGGEPIHAAQPAVSVRALAGGRGFVVLAPALYLAPGPDRCAAGRAGHHRGAGAAERGH